MARQSAQRVIKAQQIPIPTFSDMPTHQQYRRITAMARSSSEIWPVVIISRYAIRFTKPTLAIDLINSANAIMPNMRLRPLERIEFIEFGHHGWNEVKPTRSQCYQLYYSHDDENNKATSGHNTSITAGANKEYIACWDQISRRSDSWQIKHSSPLHSMAFAT